MGVFVIGPHRSGTSAVTRLLSLCGLSVGPSAELLPATVDNPRGYWESLRLIELNEQLMYLHGADWRTACRIDAAGLPDAIRELFDERAAAWVAHMEGHGAWVAKDPRLCLTYRFWATICCPSVVLAVRHPAAVIASLASRQHARVAEVAEARTLWRRNLVSAVESTVDAKRIVVDYDRVVANPDEQADRLVEWLGPLPVDSPERVRGTELRNEFPSSLCHYNPQQLPPGYALREDVRAYQALADEDWATFAEVTAEWPRGTTRFDTERLLAAVHAERARNDRRLEEQEAHATTEAGRFEARIQDLQALVDETRKAASERDRAIVELRESAANTQARLEKQLGAQFDDIAKLESKIDHLRHAAKLLEVERAKSAGKHQARVHELTQETTGLRTALEQQRATGAERVKVAEEVAQAVSSQKDMLDIRLQLALAEVDGLKHSWSYRVGRVLVFPASLAKMAYKRVFGENGVVARRRQEQEQSRERLAQQTAARERLATLSERPRFSILMPVYNTPPDVLQAAIESVVAQEYETWELCIVDDASTDPNTRRVLADFAKRFPDRVKVETLESNSGIAGASNAAAAMATGDFIALLDHDDTIEPDALLEVALRLQDAPDADIFYSDEDKLDESGRPTQPFHKPSFSPELLLSCNYICHFLVVRKELFDRIDGFRSGMDGSQDYDLVLRATELARQIVHIPRILYHWRMVPGSAAADPEAKGGAWRESSRIALRGAAERRDWRASVEDGIIPGTYRVRFEVSTQQHVTIVIPTRDRVDLLKRCLDSIRNRTLHTSYDILVVCNNCEQPETFEYLERAKTGLPLRYIEHNAPFNFARINNTAVRETDAPHILFLNNDVEVLTDNWLGSMLEHSQRSEVGAVGARLIYPNQRVQHAGIVLGIYGIAGHVFRGMPIQDAGYFGLGGMVRNCSAVTGACLMLRREVFEAIDGFDENLAVAFNDVDLCIRIRDAGYRIVYTPYATLTHFESVSRGSDDTPETTPRFHAEIAYMLERWGDALYRDPFYNPNLALWSEQYDLRTSADAEQQRSFIAHFSVGPKDAQAPAAAPIEGVHTPALRRATAAPAGGHVVVPESGNGKSRYKHTWNGLSQTQDDAKLHVIGTTDEAAFRSEGSSTLAVLEETVGVQPSDVVLEIGCGVGRVGEFIAPRCSRWIGCDVSTNMLSYAAVRLADLGNVDLREVSGYELTGIQDKSVDVVYCTVVMMHLEEWDRFGYMLEARRVLRDNGRIYVDNFNLMSDAGWAVFEEHYNIPPDRRPYHISRSSTPQELLTYLERAGFCGLSHREDGLWVRAWGSKQRADAESCVPPDPIALARQPGQSSK